MPTFSRSSTSDCNNVTPAASRSTEGSRRCARQLLQCTWPFLWSWCSFRKKQHLHSFLNVNYFSSEVIRESFVSLLQIEITTLLISYRCQMRQMWSNVNWFGVHCLMSIDVISHWDLYFWFLFLSMNAAAVSIISNFHVLKSQRWILTWIECKQKPGKNSSIERLTNKKR